MKNVLYCVVVALLLIGASQVSSTYAADFVPKIIKTEPGAFKEAEAHVQGICCTEDAIYAVFMNYVYKLDWTGKVFKSAPITKHAGDPCVVGDKMYISMSYEERIAVFELDLDLNLLRKINLEECPACDGIAFLDGYFYIGGPSQQQPHEENLVHVYDANWNFVRKGFVNFGVKTNFGPQSICAWNNKIFYAFYKAKENPAGAPTSVCVDPKLNNVATFELDGSNGWTLAPQSKQPNDPDRALFLVAVTTEIDGQTCAQFRWYEFDNKELKFTDVTKD